jgi:hypothetical protein
MSASSLVMLSRESEPSSKKTSKGLRVNQPGDAFEQEADRVADTVSAGGHIPGWSLASTGADQIQRDSNTASALPAAQPIRQIGDPQDPPQSNNYGDMLGKLAEAFLQTSAGKTIVKYLTDQPIVQDAKDFVQTPRGVLVAGSTAIAAISGLAAAHKGLPIQIPAIPQNMLHPGLKMKIDVEGPLDHPTQGSLMFSFEGAPPKKKKGALTDKERFQAETARIAEDQRQFRAGMAPYSQGPVASPKAQQQQADEQLARKDELRRMSDILQPGATHKPGQFTPLVPGTQPLSLHMRDADRNPAPDATNKEKREEIHVQRKAESAHHNEHEAAPEVESVISSSGRPLDQETRRYMESRIGFDFSKVRVHTDSRAAASAKSLSARAYTVGNNVVFGLGRFAPTTTEGRRLIGHELTHVVQQSPARGRKAPGPASGNAHPFLNPVSATALTEPLGRGAKDGGHAAGSGASTVGHTIPASPPGPIARRTLAKKTAPLSVSEAGDASELEAEQVADSVSAMPKLPVVSHAAPVSGGLRVQRDWSDAPLGPIGGAKSHVARPPSFGWNRGETTVGTIRRIPIEGLKVGNQQVDPNAAAEETAQGRAIVLLPKEINLAKPVEVLLHLHGQNIGYRQRRTAGTDPLAKPGTVRDVEMDLIEQQVQASGRPILGILAQGIVGGGSVGFNSNDYIAEVFSVLAGTRVFGESPIPKISRVVLSGHSGAGSQITSMFSEPHQPRLPSSLGEVALFDSINGDDQLVKVQAWALGQLDHDLSVLTASGTTPKQQVAYLQTSLRFRAYFTTGSYYASRHAVLDRSIRAWFSRQTAALGGKDSPAFTALRSNYQIIPVGHGQHDQILGRNYRLLDALRALPPTPIREHLHPIRADEQGIVQSSVNFGTFSIFIPEKVTLGSRKDIEHLKVHVFFSAGGVQGDFGNDILTHGLRGASNQSDWVLIGVPSPMTITDQQILDCLESVGIKSPIKSLRLSAQSRGAFDLLHSIVDKKITTLSLIDRVTLLDADDNADPTDPAHATKIPKVELLKGAGIDVSKITAYEVNVRKKHVSGANYIQLDSESMAAIGYVRLIQDSITTKPLVAALVNANQAIKDQLGSLPLPTRGSFTTRTPGTGQTSLQAFITANKAPISAIIRNDVKRDGLLRFINTNDLVRFKPYVFDRGISAHHFFSAEAVHELTE